MRVSPHLLPLCTLRRTPPPISLLSRFKTLCVLLRAFKACFLIPACKCNRAEACRCTFGLYAESPCSARLSRSNGNNLLKSNPFGHDKAPRWKPWVTESFAGNVLKKGGLRSYTYFDFWWQFPQRSCYLGSVGASLSEPLKPPARVVFSFLVSTILDRLVLSNQARSEKYPKMGYFGQKLIFGLIQPLILNFSRQCWRDKVIYGSFFAVET